MPSLHPGAGGGGDDDHAAFFGGGGFDGAGDFLSDDGAHGAGEVFEVHDGDHGGVAVDEEASGDDGLAKAGFLAEVGVFLVVVLEAEGVLGGEAGVGFPEGVAVGEEGDAPAGAEEEVVLALGADVEVVGQLAVVDHFLALGALVPLAFGHVGAFFVFLEGRFFEDAHGAEVSRGRG